MWGVYWYKQIVSCQHFFWGGGVEVSLKIVVLDLFLDIVDITSVRNFDFNFGLILLFEITGLVFIFVSVVSYTLKKLPFVLTVWCYTKNSDPNISYSNLSKTAPFNITLPTVL